MRVSRWRAEGPGAGHTERGVGMADPGTVHICAEVYSVREPGP